VVVTLAGHHERASHGGKPQHFRELGVDYVVLKPANKLAGITPCYANALYVVYRL